MTAMHNSIDPKMQEANPNNKFNGYYQNLTQKTKLMLPTAMWILIVVSVFCGLSLIASLNKTLRSLDKVIEHDEKITDLAVKLLIDDGYDFNREVDLASQLESKISPVKAAATQQATTSMPSESDKLDSNIKDSTKIAEQVNKSMFDEMDKSVRNLIDSFTKMTGFGSKVNGDKQQQPQLLPGTPISGSIMISSSIPLDNEHPHPNGPAFGNSPFSSFSLPPFIQNLFPSFGRRPLFSNSMMADGGFNEPIEMMMPREEASEVITNFLQPPKPIDGANSDGKQAQKGSLISANIGKLNVNINSPQDDDNDDRDDNGSNSSENPALSNLESLLNQAFKSDHKHFDNVNSIGFNKEPETLISTSVESPFEQPPIVESYSFLGRPSFTKQQTPFIKHGNVLPPLGFPFPPNSKDNQEPIVMMIGTSFENDDSDKPKDVATTFFDDDIVKVEPFFKQTNKDNKKLSKQPEPYEFMSFGDISKPKNEDVEFVEKKISPFKIEEDPILNMMSKVFGFTVNKDKLNHAKENKQDSHVVKVDNNENKDKTGHESILSADPFDDIPIFHLGTQTISLPLNTNNDGKAGKKVSSEIEYASKKSEKEKNKVSTTKPQIDIKEFSASSSLKNESPFVIKSAPQFEAEKPSIAIKDTKDNEAKVEKDDKKVAPMSILTTSGLEMEPAVDQLIGLPIEENWPMALDTLTPNAAIQQVQPKINQSDNAPVAIVATIAPTSTTTPVTNSNVSRLNEEPTTTTTTTTTSTTTTTTTTTESPSTSAASKPAETTLLTNPEPIGKGQQKSSWWDNVLDFFKDKLNPITGQNQDQASKKNETEMKINETTPPATTASSSDRTPAPMNVGTKASEPSEISDPFSIDRLPDSAFQRLK